MAGSGRRLGGWWRLWIVGSVAWGLLAWSLQGPRPNAGWVSMTPELARLYDLEHPVDTAAELAELSEWQPIGTGVVLVPDTQMALRPRSQISGGRDLLAAIDVPAAERSPFQREAVAEFGRVKRDWWWSGLKAIAIPPLVVLLLVAIGRWIWRGFAPGSSHPNQS